VYDNDGDPSDGGNEGDIPWEQYTKKRPTQAEQEAAEKDLKDLKDFIDKFVDRGNSQFD